MGAVAELTTETIYERTKAGGACYEVRKVKLKFWDKKSALVDLGKHLGMFKDQSLVDVNVRHTLEDFIMASYKHEAGEAVADQGNALQSHVAQKCPTD
jgi:hypothetical protein